MTPNQPLPLPPMGRNANDALQTAQTADPNSAHLLNPTLEINDIERLVSDRHVHVLGIETNCKTVDTNSKQEENIMASHLQEGPPKRDEPALVKEEVNSNNSNTSIDSVSVSTRIEMTDPPGAEQSTQQSSSNSNNGMPYYMSMYQQQQQPPASYPVTGAPMTAPLVTPPTAPQQNPPSPSPSTTNDEKKKRAGVPHVYHDYSAVPDSMGYVRKKTGGVTQPFPEKLMELLMKETDNPAVVGWLPHGRAFIVRKPKTFTGEIMPKVSCN